MATETEVAAAAPTAAARAASTRTASTGPMILCTGGGINTGQHRHDLAGQHRAGPVLASMCLAPGRS
jgi:hypothetical protein